MCIIILPCTFFDYFIFRKRYAMDTKQSAKAAIILNLIAAACEAIVVPVTIVTMFFICLFMSVVFPKEIVKASFVTIPVLVFFLSKPFIEMKFLELIFKHKKPYKGFWLLLISWSVSVGIMMFILLHFGVRDLFKGL